ncbi:ATP-binding protein [Acidithiobacillus sp. IBUN Pt1247-S3]
MLLLAAVFLLGQAGVYLLFHNYVLLPAAQRFGELLWQTDMGLRHAEAWKSSDNHLLWRSGNDAPGHPATGFFLRETANAFAKQAPGADLRVGANGSGQTILWIRSGQNARWLGIESPLMSFGNDEFMLMRLGVIAIVTLLGALLAVRHINRPLAQLAKQVGRIGGILEHKETWPSVGGPLEVAHLEQAILAMRKDLRRLHEEQTLLLTGISHELRTPLSRLLLSIHLPESKWPDENRRVGVLSKPFRASLRDRPCAADQIIDPSRPGHRRTVTPSLGRRRCTRLPNGSTPTMRHSTRLHSQLTRSLRRMQYTALASGDYSPPLRSPGSQREAMLADIEEMNSTIGKFLALVRSEDGEHFQSLRFFPWFTEMLSIAEERYGLEILCSTAICRKNHLFFSARPMALERVMRILFDNVQRYAGRRMQLHGVCHAEGLTLRLWDYGVPVPAQTLASLNSGEMTASSSHGCGLGVRICHRVLAEHGGGVQFSQIPGGGLCVTLILPNGALTENAVSRRAVVTLPSARK